MGGCMRVKGTTALALCAMLGVALACPAQSEAATQKRGTTAAKPVASASTAARPQAAGTRQTAGSRQANAVRSTSHTASRQAHAARPASHTAGRQSSARSGRNRSYASTGYSYGGGISCVPYARSVTGMAISGNGGQWWYNAAGTYARGQRPEPGSILAFPGSGGMRRGHVAVVSKVHGPRHIEIDHANWGGPGIRRGTVMRNVDVIDVSPRNDWTQVRVQVGWEQGSFGRPYPTYGFIYNRPDRGMMTAFTGTSPAAAQPVSARLEEVAELPRTAPTRRSASSRTR